MKDFKDMAKLLSAIKASEDKPVFNVALVDERVLKMTTKERDKYAYRLFKENLIEGLYIIDDIDNQTEPLIIWERSKPRITIKGLEFMQNNDSIRKAVQELKNEGLTIAATLLSNTIQSL